jgi:hypothetical protein
MRWSQMEQSQPRLAEIGGRLLLAPGVVLVGTVRRDGSPRISPVEPYLMDGELFLAMLWGSRKAGDLVRDPRLVVHSIVVGREGGEGEFKVRGTARVESDATVQQRYASAVSADLGWSPVPGRFHLFAVDIDDVTWIRYDEPTGDQYVAAWPPAREFVRRGTSATSVGDPQPIHDVLADPSA